MSKHICLLFARPSGGQRGWGDADGAGSARGGRCGLHGHGGLMRCFEHVHHTASCEPGSPGSCARDAVKAQCKAHIRLM